MKTITALERDIVSITLKMYHEFPELSKYIGEIPENFTGKASRPIGLKKLKEYTNSLNAVVLEYVKTRDENVPYMDSEALMSEGYPHYPPAEDIYNQEKLETEINPGDISKNKVPIEVAGTSNEKNFNEEMSGDDLDVPGSELDDQQERIGSEDEENNYYSLGGDDHPN